MRFLSSTFKRLANTEKMVIKNGKIIKTKKDEKIINIQDNKINTSDSDIKYAIIAYCSETYLDAYNFVVPSWIQNSLADKIFIYTDSSNFNQISDKVNIIPAFSKNDTWIMGTGRRLDVIKDFTFNNDDYEYFAFLDIDCFITKDFSEVFEPFKSGLFDFSVTRLFSNPDAIRKDGSFKQNATATAGVFFARKNHKFKIFINEWINLAETIKRINEKANREHKVSYVQYSFTELAWGAFHEQKPYKLHVISEKIYNSELQDIDAWKKDIEKYKPKILHFKGNRYSDKQLCQEVFELYQEKNPYGITKENLND